jgi:hypothetical protein
MMTEEEPVTAPKCKRLGLDNVYSKGRERRGTAKAHTKKKKGKRCL